MKRCFQQTDPWRKTRTGHRDELSRRDGCVEKHPACLKSYKAGCSWCFREGNGTPLQYSCLENPMDGGAQ